MDQVPRIAETTTLPLVGDGDGVPKYVSVYRQLARLIEAGHWKPGDQLPSETDLTRTMPVSLGTVQKALRMLSDQGLVVRRHGHGTFVAGAPTTKSEIRNFRFIADDGQSLLPLYTRVLAIESSASDGPWARFLRPEKSLVRFTRLINVNLEFQTHSELYLPMSRFGAFLDVPLHELDGASLTHLLGEKFNAPVIRFVHRIGAALIPDEICRLIGVTESTQGSLWEMFGYTFRNLPISYQRVNVPPNSRRLELGDPPPQMA